MKKIIIESTLQEKNILIAEWLNIKYKKGEFYGVIETSPDLEFGYIKGLPFVYLDFESDSNLQWLCLEKIAKDENVKIGYVLQFILKINSTLNSKQDLFEEIINYIKSKENGNKRA